MLIQHSYMSKGPDDLNPAKYLVQTRYNNHRYRWTTVISNVIYSPRIVHNTPSSHVNMPHDTKLVAEFQLFD